MTILVVCLCLFAMTIFKMKKYIMNWSFYYPIIRKGIIHSSNRIYPYNNLNLDDARDSKKKFLALTFGEYHYKKLAEIMYSSLYKLNVFDYIKCYSFIDIDDSFWETHKSILTKKKGAGYWLWKPYFCQQTFDAMEYGDVMLYIDGGLELKCDSKQIEKYRSICERSQSGIVVFEQIFKQESFTKGDIFVQMNMPMNEYGKLAQHWAAIFVIQKRKENENFTKEWLHLATLPGLIDDTKSITPNHSNFIDNRHDQSIFSLLAWKYKAYIDPAIGIFEVNGRPVTRRDIRNLP